MAKRIKPSKQIDAAYNMGQLEARVSTEDPTLKASDFTKYLINCEEADMMADNKVLKYIIDNKLIWTSHKLKKIYDKYKSKYWK